MNFRSIDLETTGLPEQDGLPTGIMQIGWCDGNMVDPIQPPQSRFVNCGIGVSIEARAVHHISDGMVADGIGPTEACGILADGDFEYQTAHNIDHEKHYVGAGFKPGTEEPREWICTYKTAFRLWPDAPGHKLHELRYFLDLDAESDFDPQYCQQPHRAPDDAYVGAHLLRRILVEAEQKDIPVSKLVHWSSGPALLVICFMKKHKGKPWSQVARDDRDYLVWIYEKSDVKDRDILATVKYWLKQTAN